MRQFLVINLLSKYKNVSDQLRNFQIINEIFRTSFPMMLSQFLMTLSGFISALILSLVSMQVFSASMLISSTQLVVTIVPYAIFFCIGPIISHIVGAKQNLPQIGVIFRSSLWVGMYISILLMALLWFIEPVLEIFGQPKDLSIITEQYFHAFLWSLPAIAFMRVSLQILNGLFQQRIVLIFSVSSLILSSLLGYLLVFGKGGLPNLGVAGLGWGFVIQAYLLDIIILIYMSLSVSLKPYGLFRKDNFTTVLVTQKKLFEIGGPIALRTGNELMSFFITTLMVGWLGATALMAKQVVARYLLLIVIPLFGLSQAASLFVGKYYGQKAFNKLTDYTHVIMGMGLMYSVTVLIIFWLMPRPFITLFMNHISVSKEFFRLVSLLLVIAALSQVFDTIRAIATGALLGLGDTRFAMWLSFLLIWPFGLTLAYLFGFSFHWGLIGITVAHLVATILGACLIYFRWRSQLFYKTFGDKN